MLHCTADNLKYKYMNAFDRAMNHLDKAFGFVSAPHCWVSRKDEGDKILVVERGGLCCCLCFKFAACLCVKQLVMQRRRQLPAGAANYGTVLWF